MQKSKRRIAVSPFKKFCEHWLCTLSSVIPFNLLIRFILECKAHGSRYHLKISHIFFLKDMWKGTHTDNEFFKTEFYSKKKFFFVILKILNIANIKKRIFYFLHRSLPSLQNNNDPWSSSEPVVGGLKWLLMPILVISGRKNFFGWEISTKGGRAFF